MVRDMRCDGGHDPLGGSGAAGLLLRAPDARRQPLALLRRGGSLWGDLWGVPGGPHHSDETPAKAALRDAANQAAVNPGRVRVRGTQVHRPGEAWSFTSVIADATEPLPVRPQPAQLAWVPEDDVAGFDLHPAFAAAWPELRVTEIGLVVDAANVVGSRPDGWWKDRAGAAERLQRVVAAAGPGVFPRPQGGFGWVANPVLVLEGAAVTASDVPGVEAVRAPGAGDDTIVDIVSVPGDWLVVTADRALRGRLPPHACAISPSAFLSWVSA
ncbi:MAG TPA: NUDIX domain-containing protein [Pseudonocardiaceae bacterium]|nr:NUDIX domain-containing protein [Pseudonocardiaceae bacterium]